MIQFLPLIEEREVRRERSGKLPRYTGFAGTR
jgi:hypothetical protein